jgi:hypothetical protein
METVELRVTTKTIFLTAMDCSHCGVTYGLDEAYRNRRTGDGGTWYCPNGHGQVYRETDKMRLEREREARRRVENEAHFWREQERERGRQLAAQKGVTTRLKRRADAGVCPHCNRSFAQVRQHISKKHPEHALIHEPEPRRRVASKGEKAK